MANVIINDTNLTNIANAIRTQNGTTDTYKPSEMATAITNLPTGGGGSGDEDIIATMITGGLTEVDNSTITRIASYGLAGQTNLTKVNLPNVTRVGVEVFNICNSIAELNMPNISSMSEGSFANCGVFEGNEIVFNLQNFNANIPIKCFEYCNFKEIILPGATYVNDYCFRYSNAKKVDLGPNCIGIQTYGFYGSKAEALILRKTDGVVYNANSNVLKYSNIENGTGYIYVPRALIEEYKVASKWSTYANQFRAIEDYPDICG